MDGTEYITLKEAGEISGYSPDYIGQLIRRGKITGKQVYANVAWVTTRDALREYLSEKGKSKKEVADQDSALEDIAPVASALKAVESPQVLLNEDVRQSMDFQRLERMYVLASRAIIVIATVFLVFLFHVFSTLLDDRLERRALERVSGHASSLTL